MSISARQKASNFAYVLIGFGPLAFLISFISFLHYTGNGFGKTPGYSPRPENEKTYLVWLNVINVLENIWIFNFFMWILLLIITAIFLRNIRTKPFVISTAILFLIAIYISFFSVYGGHEGWLDNYHDTVLKINHR